jgi:hypothetical protein
VKVAAKLATSRVPTTAARVVMNRAVKVAARAVAAVRSVPNARRVTKRFAPRAWTLLAAKSVSPVVGNAAMGVAARARIANHAVPIRRWEKALLRAKKPAQRKKPSWTRCRARRTPKAVKRRVNAQVAVVIAAVAADATVTTRRRARTVLKPELKAKPQPLIQASARMMLRRKLYRRTTPNRRLPMRLAPRVPKAAKVAVVAADEIAIVATAILKAAPRTQHHRMG